MRNCSHSQVSTLAAALVSITLQVTTQHRPSFAVTDLKEGFVVRTLETGHKSAAVPILKTATEPLPARHLMSHLLLNDGREWWTFPAQQPVKTAQQSKTTPTKFDDVTSAFGLNFQHIASHTSRKYLIETMGSGVALFL